MNAFTSANKVEAEGQRILIPWLRTRYDHVVLNTGGRLHMELQRLCDCFANKDGQVVAIEIKVEEEDKHGNLFLESWSNKSQYNPGWFVKSDADLLIYYFLESDDAYVLNLPKLKAWGFTTEHGRWLVSHFPERVQDKRQQRNDTWGWCVPIQKCIEVAGRGQCKPKEECYADPFRRAQIQTHDEWMREAGLFD
jgi:hypothetical protein